MSQGFSFVEKRFLWLGVVALLVAIGSLSFVGLYERTEELPGDGGIFYEGVVGRVSNLNPLYCQTSDIDRDLCRLLFSGLTKFDPETGEVRGDLAYKWQVSEDQKVYTFYLRDGATFHDGTPVTRDDVLFTYMGILQHPAYDGTLKGVFANVEIAAGDTSRTIIFTLENENAFFPRTLSIGILPQHLLEGIEVTALLQDPYNRSPIGSGPFMFDSLESATHSDIVKLRRYDGHYANVPHISNLTVYGYNSIEDLWNARGSLDGLRQVPTSQITELQDDEDFEIHEMRLPRHTALFLNNTQGALRDVRVRRGLRAGIQIDRIVEYVPRAEKITSPIPALHGTDQESFNQDRAKEHLFEGGWKIISAEYEDGIRRNSNDEKLTFNLVTTKNPDHMEIASFIQEDLQNIGVEVEIITLDSGDLLAGYIRPRNFDMLLYGETIRDPLDLYPSYDSSQIGESEGNLSLYKNVNADLMMFNIRNTQVYSEQLALAQELVKLLYEDAPAVYLYSQFHAYTTSSRVKHVIIPDMVTQISDRFTLFHEWFVEGDRIWK